MKAFAALIVMALAGSLAGAPASPAWAAGAWTARKTSEVEQIVARFLKFRSPNGARPPAISVGVSVGGELVVARGWGEASPGVEADAKTVYRVGSITKQFTAAAILKLIEDEAKLGLPSPLTLDRPLRDLFEGVEHWETPGAPAITVRSLLTMTSNLPNFTNEPLPATDRWGAIPADRLLSEVKKLTPKAWPNSFAYSNTSYFLLSEIIEMRSGSQLGQRGRYREFLREELLRPAGMSGSGFADDLPESVVAAEAHYNRPPAFNQPDWLKGSGDMASSVVDLFAWDKALMEGRVVSPSARALLFSSAVPVSPTLAYGMGFYVEHPKGLDIFSHSGTVPGFTAFNAIVKERGKPGWISVTLLTNSDGVANLERLADALVVVALQ